MILNSSMMLQLGSIKSGIGQGQQVLPKVSLSKESCGEATLPVPVGILHGAQGPIQPAEVGGVESPTS